MIKKIIYITLILIIGIFSFSVISLNRDLRNSITTSGMILSSEKIGWGIKRNNNHNQPDVGEKNKIVLEENGGICLGNKDKGNIYLTFDCGYEAGYTSNILKTLKENNVSATFFITGHFLNTHEELVKQMIDEGHIVGNHTINHKSMPDISDEDIKKELMGLHQSIFDKFEYEMKYMRPPKGEFNERTLKVTNSLGYKTVMWSFAYEDWDEKAQPEENKAKEKIISNIHNGEIMLLHSTSKTNMQVLPDVVKTIKEMGYEFKSLDSFE